MQVAFRSAPIAKKVALESQDYAVKARKQIVLEVIIRFDVFSDD